MLKRGKLIHEDQRGISLIEMVTVLALIGLLGAAIVMTLAQVLNVSSSATDRMIAVRQVQQAGKEVSKDVLQSSNRTIESQDETGFPLNLRWSDHEASSHNVTYEITVDNKLQRTSTITPLGGDTPPETVSIVAEYLDVSYDQYTGRPLTYCEWDSLTRVLTFRVTATVGHRSETRTYEIQPRPTG